MKTHKLCDNTENSLITESCNNTHKTIIGIQHILIGLCVCLAGGLGGRVGGVRGSSAGRGRLCESATAVSSSGGSWPTVESCLCMSEHPEGPMCETRDHFSSFMIVVRPDNCYQICQLEKFEGVD